MTPVACQDAPVEGEAVNEGSRRGVDETLRQVRALAKRERLRCLWFMRDDPVSDVNSAREVLRKVAQYGDREAFQEARRLQAWLSQTSSATSAS